MKIISADERLSEKRGAKILITGPTGVGKTSLLRTLDPARTLFLDSEAGDLSVRDVPVDTIRVDDWRTAVDLACRIGGPNPSFPPTSAYSAAHYEAVGGALENLDRYESDFRRQHYRNRPALFSSRRAAAGGALRAHRQEGHPRSTYGLHGRQMVHWLQQLQHARGKNVVFVAVLERVVDEFNRFIEWRPQLEGGKTGRELPAIVDQIVTMQWVDFGDGKPVRAFVCTSPNPWGYPAKDRSGRLEQVEPPDLGKLIAKLIPTISNPAAEAA